MNKTLVLLYHHCHTNKFVSQRPDRKLFVTKKQFKDQINWLKKFFNIISMNEILLKDKQRVCKRNKYNIVITFDDGHYDNMKYAIPILSKNNAPVLIYITTSWIDQKSIQWRPEIIDLLQTSKKIYIPNKKRSWDLIKNNKKLKNKHYDELSKLFVFEKYTKKIKNLEIILSKNNRKIKNRQKDFLSWKLIKRNHKSNMIDFGAHTHTHPMLSKLSTKDALNEIILSKKILEEKLKVKINHFAYPYGNKNAASNREYKLAKKAKFKTATTAISGIIDSNKSKINLHSIPRLSIDGRWTFEEFKLKILDQFN